MKIYLKDLSEKVISESLMNCKCLSINKAYSVAGDLRKGLDGYEFCVNGDGDNFRPLKMGSKKLIADQIKNYMANRVISQ